VKTPEDSPLVVRRSIHIRAPAARVWEEFSPAERFDRWWGALIAAPAAGTPNGQRLVRYEPHVGGRIEMEVDFDGAPVRFGGEIQVFAQGRELGWENDWIPNQGWENPTFVTLRLAPALGGTLVELFHYGFEQTGPGASEEHAGYEQGWGMTQLAALKTIVEG
jgi:uncharacterized protein YndB with AHSA1/START domain